MLEKQFIPESYAKKLSSGKVTWQAPSNIALVKYWGKRQNQIPENPSLSFTLNNCRTITTLSYELQRSGENYEFDVYLDGKSEEGFKSKIRTFFDRVSEYLPFLKELRFKIETKNTFPHSSGIASSASGMAALSLCLLSIENSLLAEPYSEAAFNKKASFLARLGSGSACRSIDGQLVLWGEHEEIGGSSNYYGVEYPMEVHNVFKDYKDTILLVDKGKKQVSSTVGHNLMYGHPFARQRFEQAHENISTLQKILADGNLSEFIALVESEALTLHAMMMTSMPYFILFKPNTLKIINRIWEYRKETASQMCFTLDAGANVHVLYPEREAEETLKFIRDELVVYCENGQYIEDHIGLGAIKID